MHVTHRSKLASVWSALMLLALPGAQPVSAGGYDPGPDFNGDGFADLAIGIPSETVGDVSFAGAVEVIYGTTNGLNGNSPIDDQFWTQASSGVQGTVERSDRFGHSLAVGDFDGDDYDDLAIGAPYEDIGAGVNAGVVQVLFGSVAGLTAAGNQLLTQDSSGILDAAEPGDYFGFTLEAAPFVGTLYDDLAIGSPYEDVGTKVDAGIVQIILGSSTGLSGTEDRLYSEDTTGIPDTADAGDHFGWSLAVGKFDFWYEAIRPMDLAIGVPDEDVNGVSNVGAVIVIYRVGYVSYQGEQWTQRAVYPPVVNDRAANDRFGFALAATNFGGSDETDLAIGVPYEDLTGRDEGAVEVIYGSEDGLLDDLPIRRQHWHQDAGLEEVAETGDRFGFSLDAGFFGRGSALAVGVPGESVGGQAGAGAVNVIYTAASMPYGLSSDGDQVWSQASSGIEGSAEAGDAFGSSLASASWGYDGGNDVAIGVPGEDNESDDDVDSGAVSVIYTYNGSHGLDARNDQGWTQASDALHDSAETGDKFGTSLAP